MAQQASALTIIVFLCYLTVCQANYLYGPYPSIYHYIGPSGGYWHVKENWFDEFNGFFRYPTYKTDYVYLDDCKMVTIVAQHDIHDLTLQNPFGPDQGCGPTLDLYNGVLWEIDSVSIIDTHAIINANYTPFFNEPHFTIREGLFMDGIIACGGQSAIALETRNGGKNVTLTSTSQIQFRTGTCYVLIGGTALQHSGSVSAPFGGYLTYRSLSALPVYSDARLVTQAPFIFRRDPSVDTPWFEVFFSGNWTTGGAGNSTFAWYNWTMSYPAFFLIDGATGGSNAYLDIESPIQSLGASLLVANNGVLKLRSILSQRQGAIIKGNGTVLNQGSIDFKGADTFWVNATSFNNSGTLLFDDGAVVDFLALRGLSGSSIQIGNARVSLPTSTNATRYLGTVQLSSSSATLVQKGDITVDSLQWQGGDIKQLNGAGTMSVFSSFSLNTNVNAVSLHSPLRLYTSGSFTNTGTFNLFNSIDCTDINAVFTNNGTITYTGPGNATITCHFTNNGNLNVVSGTLFFTYPITSGPSATATGSIVTP